MHYVSHVRPENTATGQIHAKAAYITPHQYQLMNTKTKKTFVPSGGYVGGVSSNEVERVQLQHKSVLRIVKNDDGALSADVWCVGWKPVTESVAESLKMTGGAVVSALFRRHNLFPDIFR